jgi:hypothetical protein
MKTLLVCDCGRVQEENEDWTCPTPQIKTKMARNYFKKIKYICPRCRKLKEGFIQKAWSSFKDNLSNLLNEKFK